MGNFKSHTARAAAVKLFDRVPSAKIPQTTNLCLFQRPFFAFLCRISSLPSYLSWTFVQFYTQTDCRDLNVRSKSGNVYAIEIEELPYIGCFAAKSISNSWWQVLVGHEHLSGGIIGAKKNIKEAKPKKLASEGLLYPYLGKVCPNFTTDVIQARTNEKITWYLPLYVMVVSLKEDKQCITNQSL